MDDIERDRKFLAKYPAYILLMVKAAVKQLQEGKLKIVDGMLVPNDPKEEPEDKHK